jgi:hypothetical protein
MTAKNSESKVTTLMTPEFMRLNPSLSEKLMERASLEVEITLAKKQIAKLDEQIKFLKECRWNEGV